MEGQSRPAVVENWEGLTTLNDTTRDKIVKLEYLAKYYLYI